MFSKQWKDFFWLKKDLEELKNWDYRIVEYIHHRNYEQLKLYFVLLTYVQNQSWNDKDFLHAMMKKKFLSTKKLVKLGKKRNFVIKEWSTKKLNKKQFSEYYFNVEKFFAEVWYTLPPYNSQEFQSLYNSVTF